MSSIQQSQWDAALTELSRSMVPSEEIMRHAKSVADRLFTLLQSKSKYSIDRPMIMGSVGKKTSIKLDFAFDCEIFVNNVTYKDFKGINNDFEDVILLSNLKATGIRDCKVALQLTIDGIDFDLIPAINFRDHNANKEQQRERALSFIRRLPNPSSDGWKYYSSLVEFQVEFVKCQSPFAHDLIRLAKYWNKTIFISEYITARSSLIESIAIFAAQKEETQFGEKSMLRAFNRFLDLIARFDEVNIVFEMFYSRSDIDTSIARQRPLVMDPSNPYNNFAFGLVKNPELMRKIQSFAKTTIARLESQYSVTLANLPVVFQVQPAVAPQELVSRFLPALNSLSSSSYFIEVRDRNQTCYPNMKVRNEAKFKGKGIAVSILQYYLWNNIEVVEGSQLSKTELEEKVEEIIDHNIYGQSKSSGWGHTNNRHGDYDITFEVPCGASLIKLSLNWP